MSKSIDEVKHIVELYNTTENHAQRYLKGLLAQAEKEAREKMALVYLEQLDLANVPYKVNVPDTENNVLVSLIDGEGYRKSQRALKFIREHATAQLRKDKDD